MADQINIPSTGAWGTVSTALNSMFDIIFGRTGWANYADDEFVQGNPLVVSQGTEIVLPNNAATVIESQIPFDYTQLYSGSRVLSNNIGDTFTVRVTFKAFGSNNNSGFNLKFDISALADGSNIISTIPTRMIAGSGQNNEQTYTTSFDLFSLNTYVDNGGVIRIQAVDGNLTIRDIGFFIERKHRGR